MDTELILLSDIREVEKVAANFDEIKRKSYTIAVQQGNLRPLIGAGLYFDLMANPTSANNLLLINGDSYTKDGATVQYYGIKQYLVYFWLAMSLRRSATNMTEIGPVGFTNEGTTENSRDRSALENSYKTSALAYGNDIIDYLDAKQTDYPLYKGKEKVNRTDLSFDII